MDYYGLLITEDIKEEKTVKPLETYCVVPTFLSFFMQRSVVEQKDLRRHWASLNFWTFHALRLGLKL